MRVLLASASSTLPSMLAQALASGALAGHGMLIATSLDDAHRLYLSDAPALMLLDMALGEADCAALLRELKGELIPLPVLLITGTANAAATAHLLRLGAQGYLLREALDTQWLALGILQALQHYQTRLNLQVKTQEFARITRSLSQDLRTPLASVHGALTYLTEHAEGMDDAQFDMVRAGAKAAQALDETVHDLLVYARTLDAERIMAPISLQETLEEAKRHLAERITHCGAVITQHRELPEIIGDRALLVELFQHLLSNALKYRSAATPQIDIGLSERDADWVMHISDNGKGIAPAYHRSIFLAFEREVTNPPPDIEGIGIGLASCRHIVEDIHQGNIWVESEPGCGSTFYISLPKRRV